MIKLLSALVLALAIILFLHQECQAGIKPPNGYSKEHLATVFVKNIKGSATGVIIKQNFALTNAHVCDGQPEFLGIHGGAIVAVRDYIKDTDNQDLCLIYAPGLGGRKIKLAPTNIKVIGRQIITFGYPIAKYLISSGKVVTECNVQMGGGPERFNIQEIDVHIRPGASGSPVFNLDGQLVGLVMGYSILFCGEKSFRAEQDRRGIMVPLRYIRSFLNKHNVINWMHSKNKRKRKIKVGK